MNSGVPDWYFENDTCITNQKGPIGPDQELVELLWRNGQVVMHSQPQGKPVMNSIDSRQFQKNDQPTSRTGGSHGNSSNLIQDDETVSWIQYTLEDPLKQEFCSNFLTELPSCQTHSYKPMKQFEEGRFAKCGAISTPHVNASSQPPNTKPSVVQEFSGNPMPAPRFHLPDSSQKNLESGGSQKVFNFSHFSAPPKVVSASSNAKFGDKGANNLLPSQTSLGSVMTVGSSHCGSNLIPQDPDVSWASSNGVWTTAVSAEPEPFGDDVHRPIPRSDKGKLETLEPTVTSSSDGSGSSLRRTGSQSTRIHGQKRKEIDAEESEEQSEATELKSAAGNKSSQRTGSSRRNRAAEVHNLSERRRRDRINEKMRALQQLIPHSNKTDKASMLDEAIEYLKSLQLQLQVMWMGTGMTPVMFSGIQHYMSQMGMGMAPSSFPPIHNMMHLPRMPVDQSIPVAQTPNQTVMSQNPVLGALNYQNQMQNPTLSEQYARYMGYHLMQSASQPMNAFRYGPQAVQHSQARIPPMNSNGPPSVAANADGAVSGKMG
ncbi:hypothetical protein L6164_029303 [Bauhinia variegata]|uniref:Uncharacterized protein n=1 Tax=Bauhinia variegata TaxID=167791 RepID=A0ACB9L9B4_BAUVA|nr:hypothetical protein L6164_029303 [Bauhinia variegata]